MGDRFGQDSYQKFLRRLDALKEAKRDAASSIPRNFVERFKELAELAYKPGMSPGQAIQVAELVFVEANGLYERYPQNPEGVMAVVEPAMRAAADCIATVLNVLATQPNALTFEQRNQLDGMVNAMKTAAVEEAFSKKRAAGMGRFVLK